MSKECEYCKNGVRYNRETNRLEHCRYCMITFSFETRMWQKIKCFFGFHDWTDIIEDRVAMVNLSPEHYTVVERLGCMNCHAEQKLVQQ